MLFYPISHNQKSALKAKNGYTTFVVHTNTMNERDFKRYERLFRNYKGRFISYSELFQVEPVYRGFLKAAGEYVMAYAKQKIVKIKAK